MKIERLITGELQSNCYIVWDENSLESIIIDPGAEAEKIAKVIEKKALTVKYIICTHGHFDHVGAVSELKKKTGAKVVISRDDVEIYMRAGEHAASWGFKIEQPGRPDLVVEEGAELLAGNMQFRVLTTPGHSPGGICLYVQGVLFTGDTIFAGSVGRSDLDGGDIDDLKKSFIRLISLPPETEIMPGHGPSSTIEKERILNFFVDYV